MGLDEEATKRVIEQTLKAWLDDKFTLFGKWTAGSIAASVFIALIYFMLKLSGWTPPPSH